MDSTLFNNNPKNIKTMKPLFKSFLILFHVSGILFFSFPIKAQTGDNQESAISIFETLNYQEVIDVQLIFPFDSLLPHRRNQRKIKAKFQYKDSENVAQNWDVNLTLRGRFRRIFCEEMPPFRIDFKKEELLQKGLLDYDDLKLVTQCMGAEEEDQNFLYKEYLCYKLYNELTPISYRVQLVNITYEDTHSGEQRKQKAFLIEDVKQMRSRNAAKKVKEKIVIDPTRFQSHNRQLVEVFQYMIGNADFRIHSSRNVKYIDIEDKIVPVPYDFDFAAVVSPTYAKVTSDFGQKSLKDRVYLGFESKSKSLKPTIDYLHSKEENLYQIVDDFKLLPGRERRAIKKYLKEFFCESDEINIPESTFGFERIEN